MITKSDILGALVKLGSKDLTDIKTRCDFLLATTSDSQSDSDDENQLFYDVVASQIKKTEGIQTVDYFIFKRSKHLKKMKEAREFLEGHINDIFGNPTKRERVQFHMLFTKIMLAYIDRFNISKNISTIFNTYQKFPAELDKAFPGYGMAGAYKMLFISGGK